LTSPSALHKLKSAVRFIHHIAYPNQCAGPYQVNCPDCEALMRLSTKPLAPSCKANFAFLSSIAHKILTSIWAPVKTTLLDYT
jgi:hypothetical protein